MHSYLLQLLLLPPLQHLQPDTLLLHHGIGILLPLTLLRHTPDITWRPVVINQHLAGVNKRPDALLSVDGREGYGTYNACMNPSAGGVGVLLVDDSAHLIACTCSPV